MPNVLKSKIQLVGSKEIEAQFKALGKIGESAFNRLKGAANDLTKTGSKLNGFIASVGSQLRRLNRNAFLLKRGLGDLGKAASFTALKASVLYGSFLTATSAVALFTKKATESADRIGKAAQQVGLTVEEYGRLQFALEQGGVETKNFEKSFIRFSRTIQDAASGKVTEATQALNQLGVSVLDTNGNVASSSVVFKRVADVISKFPDGVTKTALAFKIFGKAGAELIPTLNTGAKGIDEVGDRAERLGLILTKNQVEAAAAFNDSLNRFRSGLSALLVQVGVSLAPTFTKISDILTELLIKNSAQIKQFVSSISSFLIPAFTDLIKLINGEDVQNTFITSFATALGVIASAVRSTVSIIRGAFNALSFAVQPVLDVINLLLGTELKASAVIATTAVLGLVGAFSLIPPLITVIRGAVLLLQASLAAGTPIGLIIVAIVGAIAVLSLFKNAIDNVKESLVSIGPSIQTAFDGVGKGLERLGTVIVEFFGQLGTDTLTFFSGIGTQIGNVFTGIGQIIIDSFTSAIDTVKGAFTELFDFVSGIFTSIVDGIVDVADSIKNAISSIFDGGKPANKPGFASGGLVKGQGTSTSDSILAYLSNEEFVQRAAAVRKYGVGFMHRLNNLQIPVEKIRGYAQGGLVGGPINDNSFVPSIRDSNASVRPINLTIGGESFEGLLAPDDVASKIIRYANTANIKRAGNKPSWYK